MSAAPLHYLSLTELAREIRELRTTPLEATRALLDRIATVDAELGSYVSVLAETAEQSARVATQEIAKGHYKGPLHGVPIAIKDLCDIRGAPTLAGMPIVRHGAPPAVSDATVVARLRAAGATILGKLKLTEGAVAHHHPSVEPPINPHHASYWSGASSSGTGVAVAAGLCFGALGSDTGGSIRLPSLANGICGLKPTWGRVSLAGVFPLAPSLDHIGPMARTVADCAAILGAIAGHDAADPGTILDPPQDYLAQLNGDIRGIRVGFDETYAVDGVEPQTVASMRQCAEVLKQAGADIVSVKFPDPRAALGAWMVICAVEAAASHAATYPARAADYGPALAGMIQMGVGASGMDYAAAEQARRAWHCQVQRFFRSVDVMIAPTLAGQNPTLEKFGLLGSPGHDFGELVRFTLPFNVAGNPTLSLPSGCNSEGAPIGFQLVGAMFNEATLLRAGHAWQLATDFHRLRPRAFA